MLLYPHCLCIAFLMPWYSTTFSALMEKLVIPLQDKIEEWKKTAALLDKDHAKGMAHA